MVTRATCQVKKHWRGGAGRLIRSHSLGGGRIQRQVCLTPKLMFYCLCLKCCGQWEEVGRQRVEVRRRGDEGDRLVLSVCSAGQPPRLPLPLPSCPLLGCKATWRVWWETVNTCSVMMTFWIFLGERKRKWEKKNQNRGLGTTKESKEVHRKSNPWGLTEDPRFYQKM